MHMPIHERIHLRKQKQRRNTGMAASRRKEPCGWTWLASGRFCFFRGYALDRLARVDVLLGCFFHAHCIPGFPARCPTSVIHEDHGIATHRRSQHSLRTKPALAPLLPVDAFRVCLALVARIGQGCQDLPVLCLFVALRVRSGQIQTNARDQLQ
jgi:hypothetical protein